MEATRTKSHARTENLCGEEDEDILIVDLHQHPQHYQSQAHELSCRSEVLGT